MKIAALYGAGKKSLLAERVLSRYAPDMQVKYLVENHDFSKLGAQLACLDGSGDSLEVISLSTLKKFYAEGKCHNVVVPAAYSVFDLRDIRVCCDDIGIAECDIFAMPYNRIVAPLEVGRELLPPLVLFADLEQIMQMDIHIIDHCNITCKTCGHFSNLVDSKVVYSAESVANSLSRLSELIPNICNLSILGGEPLLHPDLDKIIEVTRKYYPYAYINMATNGILLRKMSQSIRSALKNHGINVFVSLYPPLYDILDKLIAFLKEENILFSITKFDCFERRFLPRPAFKKERMFAKCGHDMCLRGSRVGYCVMALFTDYYNKRFGEGLLPEDKGVDIFAYSDGKSFLDALHQPLELCRQCVACDTGKQYFREWALAGKTPRAEDWFIDFPFEAVMSRDGE